MIALGPIVFASPGVLMAAAGIGVVACAVCVARRAELGWIAGACLIAGMVGLILAAGDPLWPAAVARQVAVMVDLSASTRGAAYRDPVFLRRRVAELAGQAPCRFLFFSDQMKPGDLHGDAALEDMAGEKTVFAPPPSDAVLLFSDGQFPPPAASTPVYAVIDPMLEQASDAAITGMEINGDQVQIPVADNGASRILTIHTAAGATTRPVAGNQTLFVAASGKMWAELSPGDLWPENDAMSIGASPAMNSQRWWIGAAAPAGWRQIDPGRMPTEAADYLAAGVIAFNDVAADAIPAGVQDGLEEYVRDLGGAVVLCGGENAFGAGGYVGTKLEALSPLSSAAPTPAMQWVLLVDASGSMAQGRRWDSAAAAVVQLLPLLPPLDVVRVGQFSDSLRWWSDGLTARRTAALRLPPVDAAPHGPTNLQAALEAIAGKPSGAITQLLLITDADAAVDDTGGLTARLDAARVRVHLLAIGRGSGLAALEDIARDTGGGFLTQFDVNLWPDAARQVLSGALPDRLATGAVDVRFIGPARGIGGRSASPWNPTWIKPEATVLAVGENKRALAATWQYGLGRVTAAAFATTADQAVGLARLIEQPPRDPRINVSWRPGVQTSVAIDASDAKTYLNDLQPDLEIRREDGERIADFAIPQSGPGRYELLFPAAREATIGTVRVGGRVVERKALAGWYAPEFEHIGVDAAALAKLAARTGGGVISPAEHEPIDFRWRAEATDFSAWVAMGGAVFLGVGLIAWRRDGAQGQLRTG